MDLFSGLLGAVIGAVAGGVITGWATYKAAVAGVQATFANELKLREMDRRSRIQGCLSSQVLFDGTYYLSNRADEAVKLGIIQSRLFVDLAEKPAPLAGYIGQS